MAERRWAIAVTGSESDLRAWEWVLPAGFDPWVERSKDVLELHAAAFNGLGSATQVEECAIVLVRLLNGAIAIDQGGLTEVTFGGVISFEADGSKSFFANLESRGRGQAFFSAVAVRKDGTVEAPSPTLVQRRVARAASDELLADALMFFGGAQDWFDIYKALESLQLKFGKRKGLAAKGWASRSQIDLMARSANYGNRHTDKDEKIEAPKNPMTLGEARELMARLLAGAFSDADNSPNSTNSAPVKAER